MKQSQAYVKTCYLDRFVEIHASVSVEHVLDPNEVDVIIVDGY